MSTVLLCVVVPLSSMTLKVCVSHIFPSSPSICERVTPRLSHANSAVVLSAVKVLMKFLELLPKESDYYNTLLKKLSPPLVTLLSGEPEVQYVALRNINLIVQKRSDFHFISSFICLFHRFWGRNCDAG